MPEVFDPYHRWLGIPPEKQPPNHYSLLGLERLESDPNVIDNAADQRMAHLRGFQAGEHTDASQRLLNEVAAARVCLLDPDKKAAYDEELPGETLADVRIEAGPAVRRMKLGPIVAGVVLGGIAAAIVLAIVLRSGDDGPSDKLATDTEVNEPLSDEPRSPEDSILVDSEQAPNTTTPPPTTTVAELESNGQQALVEPLKEPLEEPAPETAVLEPEPESTAESRERLPLPSQDAQDKVLAELAELYQLASLETAEEKLQLAEELLALSRQTQDPAEQFALRRKSMELADEGGDAALMLQAVDAVAADFEVDALGVKQKVLVSFAGSGGANSGRIASLVANGLPVVDEALAAARYEEAFAIMDATLRASQRSASRDDRKRVYDRNKQLADLKQVWEQFLQASDTLESDADDAQAHLIAGRWYCFYLSDWEKGLPHLAKGADEPLRAVAEQDLAEPTDPTAQSAAADAWWDLAESAKDEAKDAQLLRAGVWYKKALPNITSVLDKHKLTQALEEIAKVEVTGFDRTESQPPSQASGEITRGEWVDVLKAVDVDRDRVDGAWPRIDEGVAAAGRTYERLMLPVDLEGSYEFAVEFTTHSTGDHVLGVILPVGRGQSLMTLNWKELSGLHLVDGLSTNRNATARKLGHLPPGRRHSLLVRVELADDNAAVGASLNGIEILRWTGKQTSLSLHEGWALPEPDRLGLAASGLTEQEGPHVFHSARLRLLSGKATWARPAGAQSGEGTTNEELTPHLPDPIMPQPVPVTLPNMSLPHGSEVPTVKPFDPTTAQLLGTFPGDTGGATSLVFSPDGSVLMAGYKDGSLKFWDPEKRKPLGMMPPLDGGVANLALSRDGSLLAIAADNKTISLWDTASGRPRGQFPPHTGDARVIGLSPDGKLLASCENDRILRLWDTKTGTLLKTLQWHTESVAAVRFNSDGSLLATVSKIGSMKLWSIPDGEPRQELTQESTVPGGNSLAFAPGESTIVARGRDFLLFWEFSVGTTRRTNGRFASRLGAFCFHPDGSLIAMGNRAVNLWNPGHKDPLRTIDVAEQAVRAIAFSPDGSKLVFGGENTPLQIWGSDPNAEQPPAQPEETAAVIVAPAAGVVPNSSASVVNLLEKVNPGKYAVEGQWEYAAGILSVEGGLGDKTPARISFPYSPPQEYDYIVEFTPFDHSTAVGLLLSRGDASFTWAVNTRQQRARLECVDGHALVGNPTVRKYAFEGGKTYVAEVRVRDSGVTCLINEQVIVEEFQTDYSNLSRNSNWTMPNQRLLGVGSFAQSAVFRRVEVREISGQGDWEAEK